MGRHALLSASSSHRWLACPPSARLCENYEDTGSEYAQQGTDAHSLCEYKLKLSLGMETEDPTEGLSFYDEEMEECACGYAEYVLSLVEEAKKTCKDPVVTAPPLLQAAQGIPPGRSPTAYLHRAYSAMPSLPPCVRSGTSPPALRGLPPTSAASPPSPATLQISVSKKPVNGGAVSVRRVSIRERFMRFLFGDTVRLTVIVPGNSVEELSIKEIAEGGLVHE